MLLPYLELPVVIGYDKEQKTVIGKFQPSQIGSYHQGFDDASIFIYSHGQPTQINLSLAEYEAKIQAYWNMLAQKTNEQNEKQQVKKKLGLAN
jgi:hypothetical protein